MSTQGASDLLVLSSSKLEGSEAEVCVYHGGQTLHVFPVQQVASRGARMTVRPESMSSLYGQTKIVFIMISVVYRFHVYKLLPFPLRVHPSFTPVSQVTRSAIYNDQRTPYFRQDGSSHPPSAP